MKLTAIELHPDNSDDILTLSFRDPGSNNPYIVLGITGLDVASSTNKVIVLDFGLNPDFSSNQSYSDLRDSVYKMMLSSRSGSVQLQFKNNGTVVAAISGYISKNETSLFEKVQSIKLTVECDDMMLRALAPVIIPSDGLNPADFFLSADPSTAPHGFYMRINLGADVSSLRLKDPNDTWSFEIIPSGGFLMGDQLNLNSDNNKKFLFITRAGVTIYLGDVITPGSVWPILYPGDNHFSFTNPTALDFDRIYHIPAYWGV
jgi:hypothetical protein